MSQNHYFHVCKGGTYPPFRGLVSSCRGDLGIFHTHLHEYFELYYETLKYELKMLTPLFLDFAIVPYFLRISLLKALKEDSIIIGSFLKLSSNFA